MAPANTKNNRCFISIDKHNVIVNSFDNKFDTINKVIQFEPFENWCLKWNICESYIPLELFIKSINYGANKIDSINFSIKISKSENIIVENYSLSKLYLID
jgi:hypothetical protein